jgi:hypothetical protein
MKRFLKDIGWGLVKLTVVFVVLAALARFVPVVNWLFFQRNNHTSVFYTHLEMERALAEGRKYDVLVVGSSTCEFSLDPDAFAKATGLSVIKYTTGGQTTDLSMRLATFLAPKLHCKYVLWDAYPRFGPGYTEEGVQRIILNTPDANSALARQILMAAPWGANTDLLWAARAIGNALAPYDSSDRHVDPHYVSIAPGYAKPRIDHFAERGSFLIWQLPPEAVEYANDAHKVLQAHDCELIGVVPPVQYGWIQVLGKPELELLYPAYRADSCFWDQVHLRQACVPAYTAEVARLFQAHRSVPKGQL